MPVRLAEVVMVAGAVRSPVDLAAIALIAFVVDRRDRVTARVSADR